MTLQTAMRTAFAIQMLGFFAPVSAHISLQQRVADAGSRYRAVLRVGHGCDGSATTGIAVQLPAGFGDPQAEPKAGWTMARQGPEVRWTADSKQSALPNSGSGEFVVSGKLPANAGPLWLKVLQTCEQGSVDWSQVPARGTATEGLKTPAVLLDVQAPSAVLVENGWVRPSVSGQQGSGGYMSLTARENTRLVGVLSPVAGVAEVHEMKMVGDVMRMRPVKGVDLPAGQKVQLTGGLHLMLMDLKQPLLAGSTVPLTLVLQDSRGVESRVQTQLLVSPAAPGSASATDAHKH
jgi:copper(I)-binding protein